MGTGCHTLTMADIFEVLMQAKKKIVRVEDARKLTHSLKAGLAITLVSVLYYVNPLYDGLGVSAAWALITVVLVMEYAVGGTIGRSLGMSCATLAGGSLGIGAHYVAALPGKRGEPVLLGCFVFLLAAAATFARFAPEVRARHDFGATMLVSAFAFVSTSSYRAGGAVVELACRRVLAVLAGGSLCAAVSALVFPVWAGEELRGLMALNLGKLAASLEGLALEHFGKEGGGGRSTVPVGEYCRSVLSSGAAEESLANLARWEPGHGRFGSSHPWNRYLEIGELARRCASRIQALDAHLAKLDAKTMEVVTSESSKKIREACGDACLECSRAVSDLAAAMSAVPSEGGRPQPASAAAAAAAMDAFRSLAGMELGREALAGVVHVAAAGSLLAEIARSVRSLTEAAEDLAWSAGLMGARADDILGSKTQK